MQHFIYVFAGCQGTRLGVGFMRGSRNFCQGGSRSVWQKKLRRFFFFFFFFFSLQLILQTSNSKKSIIFQGSGGGPTFSRGVQLFPGGSNCLFPIETHITCDFPGGGVGVRTPCPPLWIRTWDYTICELLSLFQSAGTSVTESANFTWVISIFFQWWNSLFFDTYPREANFVSCWVLIICISLP